MCDNEKFISKSPWKELDIKEKVQEYNGCHDGKAANEKFSWVLKSDREKLDFIGDYNKNKSGKLVPCDKSIDWGIPNQVIGNPMEANFFLCLLNPRTRNDKETTKIIESKNGKLKDYIISENEEIKDNNPKNQKEYFGPINQNEKEIYDKYARHIINIDENVLTQEVRELKDDDEWNDVSSKLKKGFYNKYYYLHKYYNFIFRGEVNNDDGSEYDVFKSFRNGEINPDELKICDMELFPYRTNSGTGIKFKSNGNGKYTYKDLDTSLYAASLIVSRIEKKIKDGNKDKPLVFVFRSYTNWADTIKEYLKSYKYTGKLEFSDVEEYFYRFPNQSGALSSNNIYKAKLPDDQYASIHKSLR